MRATAPPDPLTPLIAALHAGRLRTWSIVITIFGDAIQPRGGRAAMAELQAITDRLGIEGGALRTAMSRLARDGWVVRDRAGRNSFYALATLGQRVSAPATARIYRGRFADPGPWTVAIAPSATDPAGGLALTRNVHLIAPEDAEGRRAAGDLVLQGASVDGPLPDWARAAALDADLTAEYAALARLLTPLRAEALAALPPLDALALRILLIHAWRRLTLRHPTPPEGLVPQDWPGCLCHAHLRRLYPALVTASEAWWQVPTAPEGIETLAARFR